MSRKFSHLSVFAAIFALSLMVASPAFAHHKDDHPQGQGKPSSNEETVTEDNDDDGVANAPDPEGDADNRHPSGNDKHEEPGGSGNQGNSQSDPDGDSNGGADKPGGTGGVDELDQDGNNGCGNDDDFEDDNNGLCGGKKRNDSKPPTEDDDDEVLGGRTTKTCPNGAVMPVNERCSNPTPGGSDVDEDDADVDENPSIGENPSLPEDDVRGTRIERAAQPAAPEVLGVRLSPALSQPVAVAGAVLPFTGGELLVFLAAALGLIAAGAVALRLRSNES